MLSSSQETINSTEVGSHHHADIKTNDNLIVFEDELERLTDDSNDDDDDDNVAMTVEEEEEDDGATDNDNPTYMIDQRQQKFQPGLTKGYYVVSRKQIPSTPFDLSSMDPKQMKRLGLTSNNVTVPAALVLLYPDTYDTLTKGRKAARTGQILVHRGPLVVDDGGDGLNNNNNDDGLLLDLNKTIIGRVGDRVYPGDVIARQVRMGTGTYPIPLFGSGAKQPFEMEVLYQDDHFALVNKPAGVVCRSNRGSNGCHGRMTVKACLPFVLDPPRTGVVAAIRRPVSVHRLDKPTSGILVVAKTKPAMVHLSMQFQERRIKKTYTAIVNGVPLEYGERTISSQKAHEMGLDVGIDTNNDNTVWQIIDEPLDGQSAVTVWRPLRYGKSLKANDNTLTLVEVKPKTGRFHQIRRHMAWNCDRPLVGDEKYDDAIQNPNALSLRRRGLFLCSNQIELEHPYYNTEKGRAEWETQLKEDSEKSPLLYVENGKVMVRVSIALPSKFEKFLDYEDERARKFGL